MEFNILSLNFSRLFVRETIINHAINACVSILNNYLVDTPEKIRFKISGRPPLM